MLFALKCLALLLTHYRCIWEQSVITAGQTTRGLLYKWAVVLLRVALMASQTVCHLRAEPKEKGLISLSLTEAQVFQTVSSTQCVV